MQGKRLYDWVKRLADIVFAGILLLLTLPILIVTAIAVRATSSGPAIYPARRIGKGEKPFIMAKFRTMVQDADRIGSVVSTGNDPRITKIGKFLRASKIDELPQLWNVLIGQMSVVGPRPNVEFFTEKYLPEEKIILTVPQGITDYASLWFRRQEAVLTESASAMKDYERVVAPIKMKLAIYYSEHYSFGKDITIFLATIGAIVFGINPIWCFPPEARALADEVAAKTAESAS